MRRGCSRCAVSGVQRGELGTAGRGGGEGGVLDLVEPGVVAHPLRVAFESGLVAAVCAQCAQDASDFAEVDRQVAAPGLAQEIDPCLP